MKFKILILILIGSVSLVTFSCGKRSDLSYPEDYNKNQFKNVFTD